MRRPHPSVPFRSDAFEKSANDYGSISIAANLFQHTFRQSANDSFDLVEGRPGNE